MNTQSNAMPETPVESQVLAPTVISASRRMYWSVRRELWEYRSIYVAPLAVAALFLFGYLISAIRLPHKLRAAALDPMLQHKLIAHPYDVAALLIMGATFVIALFYSLDALYGERRDRSILFWKSLPVSDLTTVLSKASIPLVVIPLLSFAVTVVTQFIMLLLSSAVMLGSGLSVATLWTQVSLPQMSVDAALSPGDGACALVCANLRLAAAGFRVGAARAISMGRLTAARDRRRREDCLQHFAFRRHAGEPHQWRRGSRHSAGSASDGSDDTPHPGSFPKQPGSVDRTGGRRGLPRRSGPGAPLSRTDLSRITLDSTRIKEERV